MPMDSYQRSLISLINLIARKGVWFKFFVFPFPFRGIILRKIFVSEFFPQSATFSARAQLTRLLNDKWWIIMVVSQCWRHKLSPKIFLNKNYTFICSKKKELQWTTARCRSRRVVTFEMFENNEFLLRYWSFLCCARSCEFIQRKKCEIIFN